MATTHVFIVDSVTFKYHLEYMFAGTGSSNDSVDFNNKSETILYAGRKFAGENKLCGMIADFGRVRFGDSIIFYLQAKDGNEGKFYGVFKVKSTEVFLENYSTTQYLQSNLGKNLTFRVEIEPETVYAKGITEWEALDSIKGLTSPNQMLWSLIYRKLKGNRGNTMITLYESERLIHIIRTANSRTTLSGNKFTFNSSSQLIETSTHSYSYSGNTTNNINLLPRLINKFINGKAFEMHLQAYITQNIGKSTNASLDNSIIPQNNTIEWLGNEVSCGVGMQRIDVCLSVFKNSQRTIIPIELKAVEASKDNIRQLQRYIDWIEQYYLPNRPSDIKPMIISRKITDKTTPNYNDIINSFRNLNQRNNTLKLSYIEFSIQNQIITFKEVNY